MAELGIKGIVDVLLDATQIFSIELSIDRLLGWHNSLFPKGFSGYSKIDVAQYRSTGMKIVSDHFGRKKIHYVAPAPERVEIEMNNFLQ